MTTLDGQVGAKATSVLKVPISVVTMNEAIHRVNGWVAAGHARPRLVTFTNVHMVVESYLSPKYREALSEMDMNCPDGAPVYWLVRRRFGSSVGKVAGPEFMPLFCGQSAERGHKHFLYGGAPGVAHEAGTTLRQRFPNIQIVGHYCPPFRKLNAQEEDEIVSTINESGADVVWVCLGCPKQEQWIFSMRDRLHSKVLLAVGQAFDILAGKTNRCPQALTNIGAEWVYRLFKEPRRLWKRYLVTNCLFLLFLLQEKIGEKGPEHSRVS